MAGAVGCSLSPEEARNVVEVLRSEPEGARDDRLLAADTELRHSLRSVAVIVEDLGEGMNIGNSANLALFGLMHAAGAPLIASIPTAFGIAAILNYLLCVTFLFHRNARWQDIVEWSLYALVVVVMGTLDFGLTRWLIDADFAPLASKALATTLLPVLNFAGRRFLVFPSPQRGPWRPS